MESEKFVVHGGIKMPIGFRFHPTDEELVVHYLKRKALCLPLPASIIPELHVFNTDPWCLPGDSKENKYFFSDHKCKRMCSASGYWKPIGKEKPILVSGSNQVVGMRKTLIFRERKCCNETEKNRWFLHQFRLVASTQVVALATKPRDLNHEYPYLQMSDGDWLVYRVFRRKKMSRAKRHGILCYTSEVNMPSCICIDLTVEGSSDLGPPQPTSPSSVEVSSHGLDEEQSSGCTRKY